VVQASGLTRGDRRRNERLDRRRAVVSRDGAVIGIDLGEDRQMVVVTDPDSRVLARRSFSGKAHQLGAVLDWAVGRAAAKGFVTVTVACEPTGSRWMQVQFLACLRALAMVCVQPLATHLARESEDYTRDKSDYKDAVLIARLALQLQCYVPEDISEVWARLRHHGARREELITRSSAAVLQIRDLLSLAWPVALTAAAGPLESTTWLAAMAVVLQRCNGRPETVARMGLEKFTTAVRRELPRWGAQRPCGRILRAVYAAVHEQAAAVPAHRAGALQRVGWAMDDLRTARTQQGQVETAMTTILGELGLSDLVASIPGLSLPAAAAILAECGDPTRFNSGRALVKHAGLNPAENTSGAFRGRTRTSKRGRPRLRLAAWRAAWAVIRHNPVMAARYQHLTTRADNPLTPRQAQAACAATLLRWLHAITTTATPYDPALASGTPATATAA
jgi:transposase